MFTRMTPNTTPSPSGRTNRLIIKALGPKSAWHSRGQNVIIDQKLAPPKAVINNVIDTVT